MESAVDKILQLMATFGIGVILVLGVGFWLFNRLKKDAEKQDQIAGKLPQSESKTPEPPSAP